MNDPRSWGQSVMMYRHDTETFPGEDGFAEVGHGYKEGEQGGAHTFFTSYHASSRWDGYDNWQGWTTTQVDCLPALAAGSEYKFIVSYNSNTDRFRLQVGTCVITEAPFGAIANWGFQWGASNGGIASNGQADIPGVTGSTSTDRALKTRNASNGEWTDWNPQYDHNSEPSRWSVAGACGGSTFCTETKTG